MLPHPPAPRVISLRTRQALTLLEYRDRRGASVSFKANTCKGWIEVSGTATVLGLVLHRSIDGDKAPSWACWNVSDPVSGLRASSGHTRQAALDDLALRVAYVGGEPEFKAFVKAVQSQA